VPHPETALYRFGAEALGFDCYTGGDVDCEPDLGMSHPKWSDLTREPRVWLRRIKATFPLGPHYVEADLVEAIWTFDAEPQGTSLHHTIH
jgi:hypothetical protein